MTFSLFSFSHTDSSLYVQEGNSGIESVSNQRERVIRDRDGIVFTLLDTEEYSTEYMSVSPRR